MKYYGALICAILIIIPNTSYATITISEIMYDLSGSDTKREWIELYNSGEVSVDLSDWRFNDGSNHVLVPPPENGGVGSLIITPSQYVILASDAATFLSEHSFTGTVIDTVMSLHNTNGVLRLYNSDGVLVDSVTYDSSLGAAGDGNSLHIVNGLITAGTPTPGVSTEDPIVSEEPEQKEEEEIETAQTTTAKNTTTHDPYVNPNITAYAGENRSVVAGSIVEFRGVGTGLTGDVLSDARYVWNFGDGTTEEGQNVVHTFVYPGVHGVTLSVASGKFVTTDRITAVVGKAELLISVGDGAFVEIANKGSEAVDISFWKISDGYMSFIFPKHSVLLPDTTHRFAHSVTGLGSKEIDSLVLYYPNGEMAFDRHYVREEVVDKNIYTVANDNVVERIVEVPVYVEQSVKTSATSSEKISSTTATQTLDSETLSAQSSNSITENNTSSQYRWMVIMVSMVAIASLFVLSRPKPIEQERLGASEVTILD